MSEKEVIADAAVTEVTQVQEVMESAEVTYDPTASDSKKDAVMVEQEITVANSSIILDKLSGILDVWDQREVSRHNKELNDRHPDDEEMVMETGKVDDCPYSITNKAIYLTFINGDDVPSSKVIVYYKSDPKFQQKQIKTNTRKQLLSDGIDPLLVKYFGEWSEKYFYLIKWRTSAERGQHNFQYVISKVYKTFLHCLEDDSNKVERYDTILSKLKELLDSAKQVPAHIAHQDRCYISREAMVMTSVDPVIGKFIDHLEKLCKSMPKITAIVEAWVYVLSHEPAKIVLTK